MHLLQLIIGELFIDLVKTIRYSITNGFEIKILY